MLTINLFFDDIQAIIEEIAKLQTYKLFENDDMILIDRTELVSILGKHVKIETEKDVQAKCKEWLRVKGKCPTCKHCSDNRESGTDCPIEEHYALPLDGYCHLYDPISDCRTCVQDCQFIGCNMPQVKLCHGYQPAEQSQKEDAKHEVL